MMRVKIQLKIYVKLDLIQQTIPFHLNQQRHSNLAAFNWRSMRKLHLLTSPHKHPFCHNMPLLEPGRGDIPTLNLFLYNHSLCLACFSAAFIKTDPSCLTDLMWSHGPSSALSLLLGFWRTSWTADVLFCFPVHSVGNQHMTFSKRITHARCVRQQKMN